MTALTEAHLDKLNDEDLRALALCALHGAVSALDTYIEEHDLTNHPNLDPAPVHDAANWFREVLTQPDNWYNHNMRLRHLAAVRSFRAAAWGVGESTIGNGYKFLPYLNADAIHTILDSIYPGCGTPHRPSVRSLHDALDRWGGGFLPGHETSIGYALKAICEPTDPRLPALAESYLQSGLHVNLRPAINRATRQLAHLDELADLNR